MIVTAHNLKYRLSDVIKTLLNCRDTKRPVVRFSGGVERIIGSETFVLSLGNRILAQRIQIPLDLAWSLSVHKAQGLVKSTAVYPLSVQESISYTF